eukprot:CAMPEP_0179453028 /NCGR_PEP_ID=MMETSP0799-20121207/36806_1 /TAXON_ID=46947 /ORGANISM="Geminigera cryophila, Strain CCMP2564" /LENGTH=304 /DNA_ID=CAMNT_0021249325 /DNA_START=288 /DNA_END=1199 /DNA_ORIENTATION=+
MNKAPYINTAYINTVPVPSPSTATRKQPNVHQQRATAWAEQHGNYVDSQLADINAFFPAKLLPEVPKEQMWSSSDPSGPLEDEESSRHTVAAPCAETPTNVRETTTNVRPSSVAGLATICPSCNQLQELDSDRCSKCKAPLTIDDSSFFEFGLENEDVPTWALPPESAVNLHKVFLEWEGVDEKFDYRVPKNLLMVEANYDHIDLSSLETEPSTPSSFHRKDSNEGGGGGLREPVQLPIGLYDGYYAGTPEGHILETTQHARISREAFKRSSKSLYNHSFQWQDDDVDEDADKNRSKNVVGAVW